MSTQTARLSTFAALQGRNYFLYWLGLVFYVLGHRAEYVTFAWITWELSRDPLTLGYLGLAQGVPLVLFQLFGGVLADRMNRLRLLLMTQVLTSATLARGATGRRATVVALFVLLLISDSQRVTPSIADTRR